MTRESLRLVLGACIVLAVAAGAVAWLVSQPPDPVDLVLDDAMCANPSVLLDDELWETADVVPRESRRTEILGEMFFLDDDSAVFRAEAGFELRYELLKLSELDCILRR